MRRSGRALLVTVVLFACLWILPAASTAEPAPGAAAGGVASLTSAAPLKVAVVRSETTILWNNNRGTASHYPHSGKELATLKYLQGRGYDVTEIIGDRDLLNMSTLRQYNVIVLPLVFAMSRKASENMVRYVGEGGGIVTSLSTPRAQPEKANPPGTKNDMREWWWRQFNSNDWEWGPLSQVYQTRMTNDAFTTAFKVHPRAANPVTAGAQEILAQRGFSSDVSGMAFTRASHAGYEMVRPIAGSRYASSVADLEILDAGVRRRYPQTFAGAVSATYHKGRSVNFYFSVPDFFATSSIASYSQPTSAGTPAGEVAGALLESAIRWAGSSNGSTGTVASPVKAYAVARTRGSSVSFAIRVANRGALITYGTLRVRVYNSKGRLVHSYKRTRITTTPGATRTFSDHWSGRGRGSYRVLVTYDHGYPWDAVQASSTAGVPRRGSVTTH